MSEQKPNAEETEQQTDHLDELIQAAQAGILTGARKVQKTYSALKRGDYGVKVNTDSSVLAFGAGLGAGLGLGASLLFKMTPAGRIATVVVGAAVGALSSSLESPEESTKTEQTTDAESELDPKKRPKAY